MNLTDKSKYVYFDTSIYNRLLDDPEKDQLIDVIRRKGLFVIPSVVNMCELLMTSAIDRKKELIEIYNKIRNDYHPLKPFVWLLRDSVKAVQNDLKVWEINYPIEINEETEKICGKLKAENRDYLKVPLSKARNYIQSGGDKALHNEHEYFEFIDSKDGQNILIGLFDQICSAMGIAYQLDRAKKLDLIRWPSLPWKYYLEAYVYFFL